jgi:hypothetical protein
MHKSRIDEKEPQLCAIQKAKTVAKLLFKWCSVNQQYLLETI